MTLYTHRRQRGPRLWAFAVAAAALLLLASSSAPVSAAPPTLNASPNPVIFPFGMSTGGTTLSWSLNGAPFGQLLVQESGGPVLLDTAVKTPSGSAPLTVTYGKTYTATLTVPGTPPVAAVETITTGRLSAPLIVELPCSLRLCVESVAFGPHGTFAELTARTSKPARFEVQASTGPPAAGGVFARIDSATFNLGDVTRWDGVLLNLKPNTIYHYVLRAFAPGGAEIAMKTGTFRTLMRRVDVTLEKVTVTDDSDYWSACDCTFWFQAHDQAPKGYGGVSVSTGSSVYPGPTFSIDNPPDTIVVRVEGHDDDADFYEFCSGGTGPTWTDGSNDCMDWSFESVRVDVTSSGLGEETVEVHHLAALSGPLKFDAYVRIRIMYV